MKPDPGIFKTIPASVPTVHLLIQRSGFRYAWVGMLLVVMFWLAVNSIQQESVTMDEPLHLTGGYTFWTFSDYRLQESQGAFPQRWFALPLMFENVQFPFRNDESWHHPGFLGLNACRNFFFNSGNNPDVMVFSGRLMAMVLTLLAVLAVYGWTVRVFGYKAGLLASFLCAFDPTMLANGGLITSDVTAALFFLMSVGCFWNLLRRFTYFRLVASVLCFGLLMVSKMSGGLMVPMALLMFLFQVGLGRPWQIRLRGFGLREVSTLYGKVCVAGVTALVHAILAVAIVWCFYGWQYKPSSNWNEDRDSYTDPRSAVFDALGPERTLFIALEQWKILPDAYLYGLADTLASAKQRPAYLNGQYSMTGWWYYFPYCFLVKTPLTLIAFIAFGVLSIIWRIVRRRNRWRSVLLVWLDRTSLIWSLLIVYSLAAIFTDLNIGQRHLLPIYPPLFMLAGAAGSWFVRGNRWTNAMIVVLMMLQVLVIARIQPHYLAYFNELVGGPSKGYLHLTDSNVDWGQDLPSLSRWLEEHRNPAKEGKLYVNYFGFDSPQRWGVQAYHLPGISNPQLSSADPITCQAGIYCFSATSLIVPRLGRRPWDERNEREYRDLLASFPKMERETPLRVDDPASIEMWRSFLNNIASLQFQRLRSYLVGRKPDAMIGYSILIFRLSDAELRTALLP